MRFLIIQFSFYESKLEQTFFSNFQYDLLLFIGYHHFIVLYSMHHVFLIVKVYFDFKTHENEIYFHRHIDVVNLYSNHQITFAIFSIRAFEILESLCIICTFIFVVQVCPNYSTAFFGQRPSFCTSSNTYFICI